MLKVKNLRLLACVLCFLSYATSWLIFDTQNAEQPLVTTNNIRSEVSDIRSDQAHRSTVTNTYVNVHKYADVSKSISQRYENSSIVWYTAADRNFCDPDVSIKVCTDSQGCGCALVSPSHRL